MHSGFILFQSACHCWLCSSQKKKKQPFLEKMLLASLLLGVSFFSFFSCLCRVNLNNNNVALLTGKFSENVMARPLGAFADVAEKKKNPAQCIWCYVSLIEINISSKLCSYYFLFMWQKCVFCNICHSPGWKLRNKWHDRPVGWKDPIFTNLSLRINCYSLSKTLHRALFIPHYCKTNGHSSFCSSEWFMLKTIHLYAKRRLYHKMHATQTLTLTQWNLWSLCTMYFMLNNFCHS